VVDKQNPQPALARHRGAKQAGGTGPDDDGVKNFHALIVACRPSYWPAADFSLKNPLRQARQAFAILSIQASLLCAKII